MAASFNASSIQSIPPAVLRTIPGAEPPTGVQPLNPDTTTLRPRTLAVGAVFLAIASFSIVVRAYVKVSLIKKIFLEDYVCIAGFIVSVVQYAGITLSLTSGAGGRHEWDSSVEQLISFPNLISAWMATVFITPALGLVKLTFLIQYYRLFRPFRWVRLACWIGGGLVMAFYVAITVTMFVLATPWPNQTWIEAILSDRYALVRSFSVPTGAVGVAFDIFLVVLPIRAVTTLQMTRRKKIGLSLMFLTGGLASVASIVGLVYRVKQFNNPADSLWYDGYVWIWAQIELFAGISCSCMPSFSKLISEKIDFKVSSRNIRRIAGTSHEFVRGARPDDSHSDNDVSSEAKS